MTISEFVKYIPQARINNTRLINKDNIEPGKPTDIKNAKLIEDYDKEILKEVLNNTALSVIVIKEARKEVREDGEKTYEIDCFIIVYEEVKNDTQETAESNSEA